MSGPPWTPVTHEDMDACRGRPELLGLLCWIVRRSLARRDGIESACRGSFVAAAAMWAGVSDRQVTRWLQALEDRGVFIRRGPKGQVEWATTRALREFDRATARVTPMSPSGFQPQGAENAQPDMGVTLEGDTGVRVRRLVLHGSATEEKNLQGLPPPDRLVQGDMGVTLAPGADPDEADRGGSCAATAPAAGQSPTAEGSRRGGPPPTAAARKQARPRPATAAPRRSSAQNGTIPLPQRRHGESHESHRRRITEALEAYERRRKRSRVPPA